MCLLQAEREYICAMAKRDEIEKAAEAAEPVDAEQMHLFGAADAIGEAGPVMRRRGRPPGARNRRTAEMLEYLEHLGFEPPMLALAKRAAVPTKELAKALRVKLGDAYKMQQDALVALLPYWHQRLPQEVDVKGKIAAGMLVVNTGGPLGEGVTGAAAAVSTVFDLLEPPLEENVENQDVSGDDPGDV